MLAAAAYLGDFARAAQMLVRIGRRVSHARLADAYDEEFMKFQAELSRWGYLSVENSNRSKANSE